MTQPASTKGSRLEVLTSKGRVTAVVDVERQRSLVGTHWSAIGHYLATGDASRLEALKGKRVAGLAPLECDSDSIDEWARRGELDVEDVYSDTSS